MNQITSAHFPQLFARLIHDLQIHSRVVDVGEWHAMNVKGNPALVSHELEFVSFEFLVPESRSQLQELIEPNLPWAEDHFQERVSREPLNPAPSHEWWPYAMKGNKQHTDQAQQFSHTYPERYWPKMANAGQKTEDTNRQIWVPHRGIRYEYGDLDDVVNTLVKSPLTRQAYLPVWFPEDTGPQDIRVPCSLGYHFMMRDEQINIVYYLRSCDFVRHFQDDMYMTARLLQWVVNEFNAKSEFVISPGKCIVHISSLHYFEGDTNKMTELADAYPQF